MNYQINIPQWPGQTTYLKIYLIVTAALSSGIYCSSGKRKNRLLLPTEALTDVIGLALLVDVSPAVIMLTEGIMKRIVGILDISRQNFGYDALNLAKGPARNEFAHRVNMMKLVLLK